MAIKQAPPSALIGVEAVNAETGREVTPLTLTFTLRQWRLLAVAAGRVSASVFIESKDAAEVKAIAKLIAEQTGKEPA